MTKTISILGECEEADDPEIVESEIKELFIRLNETGYRDRAIALLDECALSLRLSGYLQGRKSAYRAKLDGDWDKLKTGILDCNSWAELLQWKVDNRSLIASIPADWVEHLNELFEHKKSSLKG